MRTPKGPAALTPATSCPGPPALALQLNRLEAAAEHPRARSPPPPRTCFCATASEASCGVGPYKPAGVLCEKQGRVGFHGYSVRQKRKQAEKVQPPYQAPPPSRPGELPSCTANSSRSCPLLCTAEFHRAKNPLSFQRIFLLLSL